MQTKRHFNPRSILLIFSLFVVFWFQYPRLMDEFQVDEDFRSFHWMNKFQDPGVFPEDQLRRHTYSVVELPWGPIPIYFKSLGYGLLFYLASFLISPILFSKILPFVLLPLTVHYAFEYGREISGEKVGVVFALMFIFINLASSTGLAVTTGLQRSFALPLMILTLYYLSKDNEVGMVITSILAVLIYPPIFLLIVGSWGLSALEFHYRDELKVDLSWRKLALVALVFLLGAVVVTPVFLEDGTLLQEIDETMFDSTWTAGNLNRVPGGRSELFYVFPFSGRGGLFTKTIDAIYASLMFVVSLIGVLVLGKQAIERIPYELWVMLVVSLLLFTLDWILFLLMGRFPLYLPSRYTRVGLTIFLIFFVACNISSTLTTVFVYLRHHPRILRKMILGIDALLMLFILLYPDERFVTFGVNMKWLLLLAMTLLTVLGFLVIRRKFENVSSKVRDVAAGKKGAWLFYLIALLILIFWGWFVRQMGTIGHLDPPDPERELLRYLGSLPKDVLIAGTPCALDNVSLFSSREILFSCEKLSEDPDLISEALLAYYTDDEEELIDFCKAYDVDYLVVDTRYYAQTGTDQEVVFFEPYNQLVISEIRSKTSFVLEQVRDEEKVFEQPPYYVIPCDSDGLITVD